MVSALFSLQNKHYRSNINAYELVSYWKNQSLFSVETAGCEPNPCGENTECFVQYGANQPLCECQRGYEPNPPPLNGCRLPPPQLCAPGPCGRNADCSVIGGREECSCRPGFTGNPFQECSAPRPPVDPCKPSPCGKYTKCEVSPLGYALCSCLPGYEGDPLSPQGCSPECTRQSDCPAQLACIGYKCVDPCPGTCGINAQCSVIAHNPICTCRAGFAGDPFVRCEEIKINPRPPQDPCNPSPCGENTQCFVLDGGAVCECMSDYIGDPLSSCKPECILSSDCPYDKVCINMKCKNPCPDTCGANADCKVVENHNVLCSCPTGYTGNPFEYCTFARK